jgi:hypothetical protein
MTYLVGSHKAMIYLVGSRGVFFHRHVYIGHIMWRPRILVSTTNQGRFIRLYFIMLDISLLHRVYSLITIIDSWQINLVIYVMKTFIYLNTKKALINHLINRVDWSNKWSQRTSIIRRWTCD